MFDARYRPKLFKEVIGQDGAVAQLKGMAKQRKVPKALLLGGPYGCGKTTLARIFARAINCSSPKNGEPCLQCSACKEEPAPNTIEVNVADERGIDTMRSLVQSTIYQPTYNYRVYILDEFHQATAHAQQALLKPLEDTRGKDVWIICTTDPGAVLPTIVSRCRVIRLNLVNTLALAKYVWRIAKKEKIPIDKKQAKLIAEYSAGHVRNALKSLEAVADALYAKKKLSAAELHQVLETALGKNDRQAAFKWLLAWVKRSPIAMYLALKEVDRYDNWFVWLAQAYEQLLYHYRAPKLVDQTYRQFHKALEASKAKPSPEKLGELGALIGEYLAQAKRYVLDPKLAALALTARAGNL